MTRRQTPDEPGRRRVREPVGTRQRRSQFRHQQRRLDRAAAEAARRLGDRDAAEAERGQVGPPHPFPVGKEALHAVTQHLASGIERKVEARHRHPARAATRSYRHAVIVVSPIASMPARPMRPPFPIEIMPLWFTML